MGEAHLFFAFTYRHSYIEDNGEQPKREKNVPCSSGFYIFPPFDKPPVPPCKEKLGNYDTNTCDHQEPELEIDKLWIFYISSHFRGSR